FSSNDAPSKAAKPAAIADYWFKPASPLGKKIGMNRFVWDLRYAAPPTIETDYSIASPYGQDVIREPAGPLVVPGDYQLRLTVAGQSYTQPVVVKADPRLETALADLVRQFELDSSIALALERDTVAYKEVKELQVQ